MHRGLRGVRTLREFDDRITAYYCGFTGADDYYERAAAANVIERIASPTLVIHAANDPFVRILPETRQKLLDNRNITYVRLRMGGTARLLARAMGLSTVRWALGGAGSGGVCKAISIVR